MSYLDVYIGDLDDPDFHYDGGDWDGNVPHRLSPFFPNGSEVRRVVIERIGAGLYDGKQTDWGGHVARVTKQQIVDLIAEQFGNDNRKDDLLQQQFAEWAGPLRRFVDGLDDNKLHALVTTEL